MNSDHLNSPCAGTPTPCRDAHCPHMVAQAPNGQWYVTMGHANFNSRLNNGRGFAGPTQAKAHVWLKLSGGR